MTRKTIVLSSLLLLVGSTAAFAQDAAASDKTTSNSSSSAATTTSTSTGSDQGDMPARPSPRAPKVFLTGGYGMGQDDSSHYVTEAPGGLQMNLSGKSAVRSFGVGTFLTPRLSVRFEMTMPQTLTVNASSSGAPIVEDLSIAQTTRTGAVLFGYHTSSLRPVSVEYLGGVIFLSQRQDSVSQVMAYTGVPLAAPMVTSSFAYKSAAIAGCDVNIALGRYLAAVPEFRAWALSGTFSTRVSLALRVNF